MLLLGRYNEMSPFRQCIAICGVEDLSSVGCYYTWNNKHNGEGRGGF